MNSHQKIIGSVLIFLLAFVFSMSASAKTYRIGILVDFLSADFAPLYAQIAQEIRAVVGDDAEIVIDTENLKTNDFNTTAALANYQAMLKDDTDIILAFGPVNNEVIGKLKEHKKPTILFGAVNTDVIAIDPSKKISGVKNFTYIVVPWSYKKDLKDFQSIYPFKRVGVVGAYQTWNSDDALQSLSETFAELDSDFEIISYQTMEQFSNDIADVDAVYMAEGFGIPYDEVKQMADLFIERQLPSFTSTQKLDVENGWLATNQSDANFERLFRRIALSVEAVINGEDLAERPVYVDLNDSVTINYNTAEKIGVSLRLSQIATTNLVGSFDEFVVDRKYTVLEAVEIALKNNLSLRASELDVALAETNLSSAKTAYLPDLTVNGNGRQVDEDAARLAAGSNPERTISASLNFSQTLYSEDGSAAIGIQKSLLKAQRKAYNTDQLDTVLNAAQASFNLLRLKNAFQSQSENLEITQRNLEVAELNYEAGQSSKADIFRFRSEMASNMQNLIDAANAHTQGQHTLNAILNNPIGYRVAIEDVQIENGPFEPRKFGYQKLSDTLDDPSEQRMFENFLIEEAMKTTPELAALEYQLESIERDMAQYGWRRYIPTVSASAQYNRIFDRDGVGVPDPNFALDSDFNVGLVFSIPLFNRNADNVSLRQARARHEQLQLQIANQKQGIEARIRNAVLELSGRIANIQLSEVAEEAAQQSLELIEASYANGAVTITDLIDSQNNYLQSQLASSNAIYNFLDSAVAMERAVGTYLFLDEFAMDGEDLIQRYTNFRQKTNQQ